MQYTNKHNIPLIHAVWLLRDDYDYIRDPKYFSATTLLKPLKEIILAKRVVDKYPVDLSDLIASRMGDAIHESVEKVWSDVPVNELRKLGYPEETIKKIRINPKTPSKDHIDIYVEQRAFKKVNEFTVGGKFDLVVEGHLHDSKSTSTFAWTKDSPDRLRNYQLQGSIYRWMNPEIITEDFIQITYVFTDWQKFRAKQSPDYPQSRIQFIRIPLMSIEETDQWVRNRLALIAEYFDADEKDIPECTDEELWRSETVYKYFSKAGNKRATKVCESREEAEAIVRAKGSGVVKEFPGEVKKCNYCSAAPICQQRLRYFEE